MTQLTSAGPLNCEETVRALWDYLDESLAAPTMAAIDAHLELCHKCREHARFERALIENIRTIRHEHNDVESLRARVLETLSSAGWLRRP